MCQSCISHTTVSTTIHRGSTMSDHLNTRVGVFVRCRPLSSREQLGRRCIAISGETMRIGDKSFTFENVFGENATQETIYNKCARHLVEGCIQGYNGTIFACRYSSVASLSNAL
jgi:hypothetical protein